MEHLATIEPAAYHPFADEAALIEQCKQWSLLSDKALKSKSFVYKKNGSTLPCTIIGLVDDMTAVIELGNKQRHCIHPSLLKEMQAANYGQKSAAAAEATDTATDAADVAEAAEPAVPQTAEAFEASEPQQDNAADAEAAPKLAAEAPAPVAKKEQSPPLPKEEKKKKSSKLQLPEEKVKLTAVVQEFTTVPNHFSDEEDEVIIYEQVAIVGEPVIDVGLAWSSNSTTLKKFELEVGDAIAFEAKIVAKKLTKHPVPYKINNPSKIQKT
ncbi:hypothetical protein [Paenibacillus sp. R14(2021)]|uniref:hypothetical protein n=1 Tax=Paenibacillus sp. R14(2021) TaxID=2859228 RepID=UPI001C6151A1|nr:hypothetical protein [Paenibacillus sp. R14(2021)]